MRKLLVLLLALSVIAGVAVAGDAPATHRNLDWQAPNLWVHVDNLDAAKAPLFEAARLGWLTALRRDDGVPGDGRALFWEAPSSPAGRTFFSFYPFATWTEFDARREMVTQTQAAVGKGAVADYDAGDAALVSPHYSQVWRRSPDSDISTSATAALTELTAGAGRLEVHDIDITQWDAYEKAWRQVAVCLQANGYPLACRTFRSSFGRGEYMTWWLAPDVATYAGAPSVQAVLEKLLGVQAAGELLAKLAAVFPVRETYEVVRRGDMCNLGR